MKPIKIKAKIAEKQKKTLKINTEYIRLDAALKLADAVSSGGQAKIIIQEGDVKVNGQTCEQRGKKIRAGDVFEFNNVLYEAVKE